MASTEFEIIERYFRRDMGGEGIVCGPGDDAAIIDVPEGNQLAVSVDTLVSGVHFFNDTAAYDIGFKSLAVNLSDMAAMAATPYWASLSLTLPDNNDLWIREFADGFFTIANQYGVSLVGGDLTRGPLSVTVQIMGCVPDGCGLRRSTAKPGDAVFVTGQLGMAALATAILKGEVRGITEPPAPCLERLNRPAPRVEVGLLIRGIASAAIDISDGLAADLGHVIKASRLGAEISLDAIPVHDTLAQLEESARWQYVLAGGDDYELCFTVPPGNDTALQSVADSLDCGLARIGKIVGDTGLRWLSGDGTYRDLALAGYRHF